MQYVVLLVSFSRS